MSGLAAAPQTPQKTKPKDPFGYNIVAALDTLKQGNSEYTFGVVAKDDNSQKHYISLPARNNNIKANDIVKFTNAKSQSDITLKITNLVDTTSEGTTQFFAMAQS